MASESHPQFLIFCLAMLVLMFIHLVFKIHQSQRFQKGKRLISILSLCLIVLGILAAIIAIIPNYAKADSAFCVFVAHWGPSVYAVFKFILYYILVLRFIRTYQNSVIEYDQKKLNIWIFIITIWTATNIIGLNIYTRNVKGKCEVAKIPVFVIGSVALLG